MEEQLISFETAKLAKEKGFDELCITYYKIENKKCYHHIRRAGYHKGKFYKLRNSNMSLTKNKHDRFSAPTQSLLQKWLRESHNINIFISGFGISHYSVTYQYSILKTPMSGVLDHDNIYTTYEEALEAALQKALELIKKQITWDNN